MLKRVFRHDVVLLCCSTLISILAAIITLIYADRLKSQSAQIEYRLQQSEKADFELQQTIFRFDVFFATDRVLETQLSNEQVNSEIRTLVGETLFFDRQAPFLFMASAVARSPEAYATLRDSYLGFSAKARQRDVAAYRDLLGLEGPGDPRRPQRVDLPLHRGQPEGDAVPDYAGWRGRVLWRAGLRDDHQPARSPPPDRAAVRGPDAPVL